jgi:hypothetical protein
LCFAHQPERIGVLTPRRRDARLAIACELVHVRHPLHLRERQHVLADVDVASKRRKRWKRKSAPAMCWLLIWTISTSLAMVAAPAYRDWCKSSIPVL